MHNQSAHCGAEHGLWPVQTLAPNSAVFSLSPFHKNIRFNRIMVVSTVTARFPHCCQHIENKPFFTLHMKNNQSFLLWNWDTFHYSNHLRMICFEIWKERMQDLLKTLLVSLPSWTISMLIYFCPFQILSQNFSVGSPPWKTRSFLNKPKTFHTIGNVALFHNLQ